MAAQEKGIWVRLVIEGGAEVVGFVEGADSPNDFWITFKTQCVRVEQAIELKTGGERIAHEPDALYVNRDRILFAKVLPEAP